MSRFREIVDRVLDPNVSEGEKIRQDRTGKERPSESIRDRVQKKLRR